jgi:hypothetical protein
MMCLMICCDLVSIIESPVSVDKSCIKSVCFFAKVRLWQIQTSYDLLFISCTALLVNVIAARMFPHTHSFFVRAVRIIFAILWPLHILPGTRGKRICWRRKQASTITPVRREGAGRDWLCSELLLFSMRDFVFEMLFLVKNAFHIFLKV